MTRANPGEFHQIDLEVERNLYKFRRRFQFGCSTEEAFSSFEATTKVVPDGNSSRELQHGPWLGEWKKRKDLKELYSYGE